MKCAGFWKEAAPVSEHAELEARLTFRPDCGRLDAALYPTGGSSVGAADEDDGASITTGLPAR